MAVKDNKVHFGIKNVYYATVTEVTTTSGTTTTYGSPVALPGAVGLDLSSDQEVTNFYADDGFYYVTQSDVRYSGDLEIADVPDSFLKDIFGLVQDTAGALVEVAENEVKYFALLFETSGDAGGYRTVLYKCSATRPALGGKTKEILLRCRQRRFRSRLFRVPTSTRSAELKSTSFTASRRKAPTHMRTSCQRYTSRHSRDFSDTEQKAHSFRCGPIF